MAALLIRGGTVVTAESTRQQDILIADGVIRELGTALSPGAATEVIDASGLYVFPGGIDPHVHMALPVAGGLHSSDDFISGTRAALAGGTTTIIDFVTPRQGEPLAEAFYARKKEALSSCVDYGLHMSVTHWQEQTPQEMKQCADQLGTPSFKVYLAYKESIGLEDRELIQVMAAAARVGGVVLAHCEHGDMVDFLQKRFLDQGKTAPRYHALSRPPEVEREAISRALMISAMTECPLYVVHVSTQGGTEELARAKKLDKNRKLWAETCPHYLLLDDTAYELADFKGAAYVMSPPLRPKIHQDPLWSALESGALQVVATDHCPFHWHGQKERGRNDFTRIPNGVAGVEERLKLLYTYGVGQGRISLNRFVELTSTQPARVFGLYPQKGAIIPGSDADLVLWDPAARDLIRAATQVQNCDTSVYEDFPVQGKPRLVLSRGRIGFRKGEILAEPGWGSYLYRGAAG